jgi:hypothetical protein
VRGFRSVDAVDRRTLRREAVCLAEVRSGRRASSGGDDVESGLSLPVWVLEIELQLAQCNFLRG